MNKVILKRNRTQSIERMHPWIFSGAIDKKDREIEEGDIVEIRSSEDKFLALGQFFSGSLALRILTFDQVEIDQDFWNRKISNAAQLRQGENSANTSETNCYRLINGEGDFLPGLIIDVYAATAVIQCHNVGMLKKLNEIKNALINFFGDKLKHIYNKSADVIPDSYLVENGTLHGEPVSPLEVLENGQKFLVDISDGQKTGFFLDQRDNRKLIQEFVKGKQVLNAFCYTGGFSIAALMAGARMVHSVDASQSALDILTKNLMLNDISLDRHLSFADDVLKYLKERKDSYEVMIIDPPAYAKSKMKRHKAVQAYKRLNALAMRQIKKNGIIFTFSCSRVVELELFQSTIQAAAIEAKKNIRILKVLQQPFDHPVSLMCQETRYLKGLILRVD